MSRQPPPQFALPLAKPRPVNVTSDPSRMEINPVLKLRSELSTAPVLLLIFKLVSPEIVIASVKVMSPTTLMLASLAIALERAEKSETSV